MPTHTECRRMPYSAEQMFELISDIDKYPGFLPWCSAARVRSRKALGDGSEVVEADLVISFKVYRERFGSRVVLDRRARTIEVEYIDGPFKYLRNSWKFAPAGDHACDVDFHVDFQFRSKTLDALVGAVFYQAMQRIVRAFERRADELCRRPPPHYPRPGNPLTAQE
ncbi:MAG: type II toxin-antitoxin system RatA family toxin [Paracoccaceae bacterium]